MSLVVFACAACGHVVFPARSLCPTCGAAKWWPQRAVRGVVTAATAVAGVVVAEVRTDAGPVVIARGEGSLAAGSEVELDVDGSVPVARPLG